MARTEMMPHLPLSDDAQRARKRLVHQVDPRLVEPRNSPVTIGAIAAPTGSGEEMRLAIRGRDGDILVVPPART
jgi:hypothetical protein